MKHSLILLCGMPRSGTTWTGKIFDSHPDTLYRHEPDGGKALRSIPLVARATDAEKYRSVLRDFAERLPLVSTARVAGSLPVFRKQYHSSATLLLRNLSLLAAKASEPFPWNLPIVDRIDYARVPKLHVVWKSIESAGRVGVIVRAVPECRAIFIVRHPCGYIASVLNGEEKRQFSAPTTSGDDFPVFEMLLRRSPHTQRNPALDDLRAMSMVERLAWRWVLYNEIALADIHASERCAAVRYEDLCSDPVGQARELLRFAGLDWQSQVEKFIYRSTAHRSARYYSVYKHPQDAATKWQQQLNAVSVAQIMNVVRKSDLADMYSTSDGADKEGTRKTPHHPEMLTFNRVSDVPPST